MSGTQSSSEVNSLSSRLFSVGNSTNAIQYSTTIEYLTNQIKLKFKHGNDIAEAIRGQKAPDFNEWLPELKLSTVTDETVQKQEN